MYKSVLLAVSALAGLAYAQNAVPACTSRGSPSDGSTCANNGCLQAQQAVSSSHLIAISIPPVRPPSAADPKHCNPREQNIVYMLLNRL